MAASLLLKRFEATFIDCASDKFAQEVHSPDAAKERLMMKVHNLPGDRRLKLTDTEAAALCEILLEVTTFEEPRSEAEVQLAREILDRLELPDDWNDPFEFAKVVAMAPEPKNHEPVERPKGLLEAEQPGAREPVAPYWP
jgi:hypothetical protein